MVNPETPAELRRRGISALVKALGPVGMIRFLQQYEAGAGDYSRDREHWLDDVAVDDVAARIQQKRKRAE